MRRHLTLITALVTPCLLSGCPTGPNQKLSPQPDLDGDGWSAGSDCDDTNPDIHPDAEERCDGIDNNCNLAIDERVIGLVADRSSGTLQYRYAPGVDQVTWTDTDNGESWHSIRLDEDGRVIEEVIEGEAITISEELSHQLDDLGRLERTFFHIQFTDPWGAYSRWSGTTVYEYDPLNRPTTVSHLDETDTLYSQKTMTYGPLDQIETETFYRVDTAGELNATEVTLYTYDDADSSITLETDISIDGIADRTVQAFYDEGGNLITNVITDVDEPAIITHFENRNGLVLSAVETSTLTGGEIQEVESQWVYDDETQNLIHKYETTWLDDVEASALPDQQIEFTCYGD